MASSSSEVVLLTEIATTDPENVQPISTSYIFRTLKKLSPLNPENKNEILSNEQDLLTLPLHSPVFIYGHPGMGLTLLLSSLLGQTELSHTGWIGYINLREVSKLLMDHPKNTWTLPKLIIAASKTTEKAKIDEINAIFTPSENNAANELKGELFMDGLDSVFLLQDLLKLIRGVDWNKIGVRAWITSRTHLREQVGKTLGEKPKTDWYLLPLTKDQQLTFFYLLFKEGPGQRVSDSNLKNITVDLHNQLCQAIPQFEKTIGASPFNCKAIAEVLGKMPEIFESASYSRYINNTVIVMLLEHMVQLRLNVFVDTFTAPKDKLEVTPETRYNALHKNLVRFAISSYPHFECLTTNAHFANNKTFLYYELYGSGIVCENDGKIQFVHKILAEFVLAQHFVDCARLRNSGVYYVNFFLVKILFEKETKRARKLFDTYLNLQQKRGKLKEIKWPRLCQYLIEHYYLEDTKGDNLKYQEIKNKGSIIHQIIAEGNGAILNMVLKSMSTYFDPLPYKKLMDMTVNCEVYFDNPFKTGNWKPEIHSLTAFQMLALFGCGDGLEKSMEFFRKFYGLKKMRTLVDGGKWSILHYAAMSSNYRFLENIFKHVEGGMNANGRTPDGKLPLHLVLHEEFYYSFKIEDCPHPKQLFTFPNCSSKLSKNKLNLFRLTKEKGTNNSNLWSFEGIQKYLQDCENYASENVSQLLQPHILSLELLINKTSNVNAQQAVDGQSVLHQASIKGCKPIVEFLLEKGADVNLRDGSGITAAYRAASNGHTMILDLLVSHGANCVEDAWDGFLQRIIDLPFPDEAAIS